MFELKLNQVWLHRRSTELKARHRGRRFDSLPECSDRRFPSSASRCRHRLEKLSRRLLRVGIGTRLPTNKRVQRIFVGQRESRRLRETTRRSRLGLCLESFFRVQIRSSPTKGSETEERRSDVSVESSRLFSARRIEE